MADEKVLTQADIDALVSKVPPKPAAPKPAAPVAAASKPAAPAAAAPKAVPQPPVEPQKPAAVPPPATASAPPPPAKPRNGKTKYEKYGSSEVDNLHSAVSDLSRQVAKMTNAMQRLENTEAKVSQISSLLKLDPNATETLGGRLDEIYRRLEALQKNSSDVQGEFQCSHCKSTQLVALHVKCTSCGEETWMGWWPEGNQKK